MTTYRIETKEETGLYEVAHSETFDTVEAAVAFVMNWYGNDAPAGYIRITEPAEDRTVWTNQ